MNTSGKAKASDDAMDIDVLYGAGAKKGKGKGKGKGTDGKGKGREGRDKGKGKSKDGKQSKPFDSNCLNCQKCVHRKKDCWAPGGGAHKDASVVEHESTTSRNNMDKGDHNMIEHGWYVAEHGDFKNSIDFDDFGDLGTPWRSA